MTGNKAIVIDTSKVEDIWCLCDKLGYNLIAETTNLPQIYSTADVDEEHKTIHLRYTRKYVLPHGISMILTALQFYGKIRIIKWEYDETYETGYVYVEIKEAKE